MKTIQTPLCALLLVCFIALFTLDKAVASVAAMPIVAFQVEYVKLVDAFVMANILELRVLI